MNIYNDTYVEQLVVRNDGMKRIFKKIGAVIAALALIVLTYLFLYLVFPFFFAVIIILLFFALKYSNVEYEYIVTNGDLDIDRIQGRRRRRRAHSTNATSISLMAPYREPFISEYVQGGMKPLDVSSSPMSPNRYFFISGADEDTRALVIFEPNEKVLAAMKKYLGPRLKGDIITGAPAGEQP